MGSDDEEDKLSIDSVYDEPVEVPVNPVDLLYREQEKQWDTVEFEEVTVEGAVRDALADASTQFHYIYLSQLIVLGDVTKNVSNVDVKRLASFLIASRIRDVDAWGRYLASLKMRTTVAEPVHTYCNHIYNDDNRLSRLMGVVLADVFRQAVGTNAANFPDPTFERLLKRDVDEGDKNVQLARSYLQRINRNLSSEETDEVIMQMDRYASLIEDILVDREHSFNQLGADIENIRDQIGAEIDAFHAVIKEE